MRKKISIFSFFSGIGILDLAFEKNGYTIVFVNEYDNLFMESYQYAREQMNRHGVPQFRERVFMVGIHKGLYQNEPNTLLFEWDKHSLFDTEDVLTRAWPKEREFMVNSPYAFPAKGILKKLTVEYWFNKNDVENHPNGKDIFQVKRGREKIETIAEGDTSGKSFKRLHRWRYSPTAAYGHNEVHLHPYKKRRISVAEAMAVQSLPKEFVVLPTLSLSRKFKMIGNGVPYLMAAAIAKTLKEILEDIREDNL